MVNHYLVLSENNRIEKDDYFELMLEFIDFFCLAELKFSHLANDIFVPAIAIAIAIAMLNFHPDA